ncbi:hypothetical protein FB45DRAFT_900204 [Roridomyces roridus]|uniref:Uncharacterized protein n=1 Tax=Roridomyces roridus TaxID=1738132 RepID=A0AAD7FW80_9AGAR|nr:hypothetical protein FB45DRAFT_900204 [Roridomyces roridus]
MLPPMPTSPGFASTELAELLAEAAALESRLEKGELPGEALRRMSMRPSGQVPAPVPVPPMPPMPEATAPIKPLKPQRSFRNPLTRSRSDRRAAVPERPAAVASSSTGNLLSSSGTVEMEGQEVPLPVLSQQRSLVDSPTNSVPPTPPPKSPGYTAAAAAGGGAKYFSSLRRLASTSKSLGPANSSARGSVSTSSELSSEDSMPVATPPDEHPISPASSSAVVWPTLTTKKSGGSIGRSAASFAGRMFSRSRTKSSASTVSSMDGHSHTSSPPPPMPQSASASPSPPALRLDSTPFFIPPIETEHQFPTDDTPTTAMPRSPPMRPPHLVLTPSGPTSGESLLPYLQADPVESRPTSWMSTMSSGTSSSVAQSPLFDKAIFDAFPSVPNMPNASSYRGGGELLGQLAERHQRVDPLL